MLDHRLVQTAVIGDKDSDHPIILPMDAHELDVWRSMHPSYSYWCGLQLGGCGGQLTDRRYTIKVCHFAHHATAPICYRTATGESSADHLFIKRGVQRLMSKQNVRGKVHTRDLGTGPGDAVDVHLPGSRRGLRFQLSTIDYRAWRRTSDELTSDFDDVDWIFLSEGPITQQLLGRHGYCLRVRCETAGGERRVHIGAEARDRTVAWTPLEDCVLTPSGIVTPHVERIRLSLPRPKPSAFPVQGGLVFALVPEAAAPAGSPFAVDDRHLLVADVKPVDSPIVRTLVSLPGDTEAPPVEHVYRVHDGARILVSENGRDWAVEANRYIRLNAHDAQRTGLWTPLPADRLEPSALAPSAPPRAIGQPKPSAPVPTHTEASKPAAPAPVTRAPLTRPELVTALRDALAQRARQSTTATWETLARLVSPALATYSLADRCSLLIEVDRPLREHVPVLSALIRERGAPLPYLPRVLAQLGVPHAERAAFIQIRSWAVVESDRAFAAYATPSRVMSARYLLEPGQSIVRQQGRAVSMQGSAGHPAGVSRLKPRDVARVRGLVTQLDQLRPRLGAMARKSATKALSSGQAWLAYQDGAEQPVEQRRKLAAQTPELVIARLERAIEAARYDLKAAEWLSRHKD